jgi:hypothetical protein
MGARLTLLGPIVNEFVPENPPHTSVDLPLVAVWKQILAACQRMTEGLEITSILQMTGRRYCGSKNHVR